MKRDKDDWLDQKITEELLAMADEREKELMEMEELQDIDMPIEKFEDIKREAERRRRKSRRGILRPPDSDHRSSVAGSSAGSWCGDCGKQGV